MSTKNGGPAFPTPTPFSGEGMSIRDHFAGLAMQALAHDILIEQHWEDVLKKDGLDPSEFPAFLAHLAYLTADAMIAQRGK